jgi:hypothetical protein
MLMTCSVNENSWVLPYREGELAALFDTLLDSALHVLTDFNLYPFLVVNHNNQFYSFQ